MTIEQQLILSGDEQILRSRILEQYAVIREKVAGIANEELRRQLEKYYAEHFLLVDFFTLVPQGRYEVRIAVDTPQGSSASTRDNLVHIIANLEDRLAGLERGEYKWGYPDPSIGRLTKADLLDRLISADSRLLDLVSVPEVASRYIATPRGTTSVTDFVGNMVPHQILHQGIHLGLMDMLGMRRPESYVARWGT